MKKPVYIIVLFLIILPLICFFSCSRKDGLTLNDKSKKEENPKNLPSSGGKTLEMILVIPNKVYKGELKDSIGDYFLKACPGLAQREPLFDIVQMESKQFFSSEMFQKHRNVLIIDYSEKNKENSISQNIDYKSFPQAYFQIIANNKDSLYYMIRHYQTTIISKYYENEHRRVFSAFKKLENIEASKKLETTFKFSMVFSNEYSIAIFNDEFAWFKKDYISKTKQRTLNIMVYKTPYLDEKMFKEENIIDLRNKIAKKYIKGPSPGSYMGTETSFPYTRKLVNINGQILIETRGLWRLFNDFMGGSFVNYCFLDKTNNQFVMIDCFLYAPNQNKRDELMQLESIVYSLKLK